MLVVTLIVIKTHVGGVAGSQFTGNRQSSTVTLARLGPNKSTGGTVKLGTRSNGRPETLSECLVQCKYSLVIPRFGVGDPSAPLLQLTPPHISP